MAKQGSFSRAEPAARRKALIDATLAVLAEHGASGVSVRLICARAGVSPGLLTHYFNGIDDVIAESYATLIARTDAHLARAAARAASPGAGLTAWVSANFRPPVAAPGQLATWIAFWSLLAGNTAMQAARAKAERQRARLLDGLILAAAGTALGVAGLREIRTAVTALVDGLWLDLCLDPARLQADAAERIALAAVDTLVSRARRARKAP